MRAEIVRLGGSKTGTIKLNDRDALRYIFISRGRFKMGCSPGDKECDTDENPAHEVEITHDFWMGQTPVTQAAYQKVTGKDPSRFKGGDRPVEEVSWDDADSYCRAIGMRLPTEAEWEYAARAGTTGARYGSLDAVAWYRGNSNGQTQPVAAKLPNAWGLYDMLGNVWEWVNDWYDKDYYSRGIARDPPGPDSSPENSRALRGGSWGNVASSVRASVRGGVAPAGRGGSIGFRCVGELR